MSDSFWAEAVEQAELERQRQPLRPTIPQREQAAPDTIASLVAAAKAAAARPDPSVGVLSTPKTHTGGRQGMTPGADVSQVSRRPGPAAEPEPSLLDLSPQERYELIRLADEAGEFENTAATKTHPRVFGGVAMKAEREHAAMVQALIKDGDFTTAEDMTPRRVDPRGVAGFTIGHGGER